MGINHIHPFATGASANTLNQSAWEALLAQPSGGVPGNGFVDGIASAQQINTVLAQVSTVAAALAQFVADVTGANVNDDRSPGNFEALFRSALGELYVSIGSLTAYVQRTEFTGSNQLMQPAGYQILPGGFVLQWGHHTNTVDDEFVNFPGPFPTQCFAVFTTINGANSNSSVNQQAGIPTRFGFPLHAQQQERSAFWFAIGN